MDDNENSVEGKLLFKIQTSGPPWGPNCVLLLARRLGTSFFMASSSFPLSQQRHRHPHPQSQAPSARFRTNLMPLIMLCSSYLNVVQPKLRLYEGLLAPPTAYTICFQLLFHEHAPALIFPAAVGSLISTQRSRGVLYENLGSR